MFFFSWGPTPEEERAPTPKPAVIRISLFVKEGVLASQSALLLGPEDSSRWSSQSMSSCDGVRPIVVEPVQFIPKGSPFPLAKAPANPITQGSSAITGLVYAVSCGTKKYLSIFFRAGEGVPNVVMVLLQFWDFGSLYQRRCGVTSCVLSRQPHFSSLSLRRLRLRVMAQASKTSRSRCFCNSRR